MCAAYTVQQNTQEVSSRYVYYKPYFTHELTKKKANTEGTNSEFGFTSAELYKAFPHSPSLVDGFATHLLAHPRVFFQTSFVSNI